MTDHHPLRAVPKVELHTHLEGCAPPAFIRGLAREKSIDISGIFDAQGNYVFRDFDDFLNVYEAACTTLQGPEDFYRLTKAVLEESARHNVVYQETFVSPDFCGGGDLAAWREYLAAIKQAADEMDDQITLRAIVTCIRHFGPEAAKPAALCAAETMGDFVTGFGMAGAELVGRPADFAYSFDAAREAGLSLTCHAGEWGGPDMVAETLDALKVSRIGHGINARHDPKVMDQLVEAGTVLEVCPLSNMVLQAIPPDQQHPIGQLIDAGVKVTVSTDDPPFFASDMTAEFYNLALLMAFDETDFAALNQTALDAAFCDDATRTKIAKRLEIT